MLYKGECCPRSDNGKYMSCCAKAKAHPECSADEYLSPEDAICPARSGKYLDVSHPSGGCASRDAGLPCQYKLALLELLHEPATWLL
jgi:hypothetical protein